MFNHTYSDKQFFLYILLVLHVQSTLLTARTPVSLRRPHDRSDRSQNLTNAPLSRRLFTYRIRKGFRPRNVVDCD
jgi:hypothetical protein